uniref:Uncharacterized protein, isoform A n=1 Tax=Drosophila melanogaster TaxID=7227 RepID=M9MS63_DROME|nr:uncharacterized protein Dmel_CG42766, isoform A [Drosophila melanogaster]ADV37680.1 uncharacterized protein Dmel_CG42766, isoform A [Drosophila melanogaster]|eukprot:NP_001188598.1 uncharacterized protein Dmel_CG42766, isoform A [Drosophila melanogaster]
MPSVEWVCGLLYYVMRTYIKVFVSSCEAHFPIDILDKIVYLIDFAEVSMKIMRRPRNYTNPTERQARRLQFYNFLLKLRFLAQVIYTLVAVLSVIHVK